MPVFRVDPPSQPPTPITPLKPRPIQIVLDLDTVPPALKARMEQLSKAGIAIAEAAQKIIYELHNLRVQPPAAAVYILYDIEDNSRRLSKVLQPRYLTPADAHNQAGRIDSAEGRAGIDDAQDRRTTTP